jgi:hypothetical protein
MPKVRGVGTAESAGMVELHSGRQEMSDRPNTAKGYRKLRAHQANEFTALVERTVDALKGNNEYGAYEDAQRILASIRKQYDEVHAEAEKKEGELMDIRKEVRLVEVDDQPDQKDIEAGNYANLSREMLMKQIHEVAEQIEESATTRKVYTHMVARLKTEQKIVQQKIKKMEDHLGRKTREVEKRQEMSRRVHGDKVQSMLQLEAMEQDVEAERMVCNTALDDLELILQQRRNEVRRREDFERWRYEVAMEAASEAFHVMAGRFRKIYAIEKLTGNCLQRIIFEQAEYSQETEDGFQKIREVTGLTDVMDIVHKFLNRDIEHEQLRISVRDAEAHLARLHGLREAETKAHSEGMASDADANTLRAYRSLNTEAADVETKLHKAQRDHDEFQRRLRNMTLLVENTMQWSRRMTKSLSTFEQIADVESKEDLVPFFLRLKQTVERFLTQANEDNTCAKLSKLTSQACSREYAEQQRLLNDKEFIRVNCRVNSSVDGHQHGQRMHHHHHGHGMHGHHRNREQEEDRHDAEMVHDRERLKQESMASMQEKERQNRANQQNRRVRRGDDDRGEQRSEGRNERGEEAEPGSARNTNARAGNAPDSPRRSAKPKRRPESANSVALQPQPPKGSGGRPVSGRLSTVSRKA